MRMSQAGWMFFFVVMAGMGAVAEEKSKLDGFYTGTVGENMSVQFSLTQYGKKLSGWYAYEGKPGRLDLQGGRHSDGTLTLVEITELDDINSGEKKETITGAFKARYNEKTRTIEGQWSSADGRRKLQCRLKQVAEEMRYTEERASVLASSNRPNFLKSGFKWSVINAECRSVVVGARQKFIKEFSSPEKDQKIQYDTNQSMEVQFVGENHVSVLYTFYEFTGGAHGNTAYEAYNWHLTGEKPKRIRLADVFIKNSKWEPFLLREVRTGLQRAGAQVVTHELTIDMCECFCLDSNGLVFHFAPYQVACYAARSFSVRVPYARLSKYLNTKGALNGLVKQ